MTAKPSPPYLPDVSGDLTADGSLQEVNELWPNTEQIAATLNLMMRGRLNVAGKFTLTADDVETEVIDNLFQSNQVPILVPTTEAAANATTWISDRENTQFTVGHDSTSDTDRTFLYVRIG